MSKPKYPSELKIRIAKEYLIEGSSYRFLAVKYGVGKRSIEVWVKKYQEQGDLVFAMRHGNRPYSSEFKIKCVEAVLRGEGSVDDIITKYNISSQEVRTAQLHQAV